MPASGGSCGSPASELGGGTGGGAGRIIAREKGMMKEKMIMRTMRDAKRSMLLLFILCGKKD